MALQPSLNPIVSSFESITIFTLAARRTRSFVEGKGYDSSKSSTPQDSRPSVSRQVPKLPTWRSPTANTLGASRRSAPAWSHEHPELLDFVLQTSAISAAREQSPCFLAELEGQPGAAGSLCIHNGVALFAGAATIPQMRRRGLQAALLQARMRYAFDHGCDLAMMVAEAGSEPQRNAQRKGFQIAYTRMKWRLSSQGQAI